MSCLYKIEKDIREFLEEMPKLFFNERDFQVNLAFFLMKKEYYDNIFLEYSIPLISDEAEEKKEVWTKKGKDLFFLKKSKEKIEGIIRIDIVVEKDNLFYPIELKYKTKQQKGDLQRFKENFKGIEILKNHGARNIGRYSFWKDVARLEFIKDSFDRVVGGFCIFITNDNKYMEKPTDSSDRFTMEMEKNNKIKGFLKWPKNFVLKESSCPEFSLQGDYEVKGWGVRKIEWDIDDIDDKDRKLVSKKEESESSKGIITFHYCIVEV